MLSLVFDGESASAKHVFYLFLFTYAKIEYVSVRTYLSENVIRSLDFFMYACTEVIK